MVRAWGSLRLWRIWWWERGWGAAVLRRLPRSGSLTWPANQGWLLAGSLCPLQNRHLHKATWQSKWYERKHDGSCTVLRPSFWSHTPSFPQYPASCIGQPCSAWAGLHKNISSRRWWLLGTILGTGDHIHFLAPIIHVLPTCKIY